LGVATAYDGEVAARKERDAAERRGRAVPELSSLFIVWDERKRKDEGERF